MSDHSIFDIMDGIIREVNKTKTVFIILIATIMIPIGVMIIIILALDIGEMEGYDDGPPIWFSEEFVILLIILAVIGLAIRQMIILNRWTRRYQRFKARQKELEEKTDEELDRDGDNA